MKNAIKLLLVLTTTMPTYGTDIFCNANKSDIERNEIMAEFQNLDFTKKGNVDLQKYSGSAHAIIVSLLSELLLHKANIIDDTSFGSISRHDLEIAVKIMSGLENSIIERNGIKFGREKPVQFIEPSLILPDTPVLYNKLVEISKKYNGFLPQDEIDNLFGQSEIQQLLHTKEMEPYVPQHVLAWESEWRLLNVDFGLHLFDPGKLIKVGEHAPFQVIEPVVITDNEELYRELFNIAKKYDGNLPADILLNEKENLLKTLKGDEWKIFFESRKLLRKIEWDTHIKTSENERLKERSPELYLSLLGKEELYTVHSFWSINPFNIQYSNCENIHVVPMTINLSARKDFAAKVFKDLFKNENAVPPAKVDFFEFYRASVTAGLSFFSYGMEQTPEEVELEHRYHEMKVSQLVQLGEQKFQLVQHSDILPKNIPADIDDRLFSDSSELLRTPSLDPAQSAYNSLPKYLPTEGEPLYGEFAEILYDKLSKFEDIVENRLKRQGGKIDARYKGIPANMLIDPSKEQQAVIQPVPKGLASNGINNMMEADGGKIVRANYIKLCDFFSTILRITD